MDLRSFTKVLPAHQQDLQSNIALESFKQPPPPHKLPNSSEKGHFFITSEKKDFFFKVNLKKKNLLGVLTLEHCRFTLE